jgi:hypothetical protein
MAFILDTEDFAEGRNKVSFNGYQAENLQWYIDKYEREYLIDVLGVQLYDLFITDLSGGVPVTPIYTAIFESIATVVDERNLVNRGMKEMLKGFVFFHYVRDDMFKQTPTGAKSSKSDNSMNVTLTSLNIQGRFNDSVDDSRVIQEYIKDNETDYPTYLGCEIDYSLPI